MDDVRAAHSNTDKLPLQRPLNITLSIHRRCILVLVSNTQQQQRHPRRRALQRLPLQHHHLRDSERQRELQHQHQRRPQACRTTSPQAHHRAIPDDVGRADRLARRRRDLRTAGHHAVRVGRARCRRRPALRHVARRAEPDLRRLRARLGRAD